ncbi:MAG TPA: YciI family protein [Casimicrobiaceae bacterium]|nr:YciI family protein [Casimicrobiaceae bacterium]
MRWVVVFEDTPPMAGVRARLESAHLAYLREHSKEIVLGGGLRDVPGGAYAGGMWIFEVASRERAVELIEGDPYYEAEPRPYRLYAWGKALPDLRVEL